MTNNTDPRSWAGYRFHTRSRVTGTLVVLVDGIAQGLDTDGGRWSVICDAHSEVMAHESQTVARQWMHHPEEWCEACMAALTCEWCGEGPNPEQGAVREGFHAGCAASHDQEQVRRRLREWNGQGDPS